jgi:hypothetical protein
MEKSRKYMIAAACLLFISQFFTYSEMEFTKPMTDIVTGNFYGGAMTSSKTGWEWHSWQSGIIIGIIAWLFYTNSRSIIYYIVSIVIILALALGSGAGANMGYIAVIIAGYAIYLQKVENKSVKPKVPGKT